MWVLTTKKNLLRKKWKGMNNNKHSTLKRNQRKLFTTSLMLNQPTLMTIRHHYRQRVMWAKNLTSRANFHLVRKKMQVLQRWSIKVYTKMSLLIGAYLKKHLLSEPPNTLIIVCHSEVTLSITCVSKRIIRAKEDNSSREAKASNKRDHKLLLQLYRYLSQLLVSK